MNASMATAHVDQSVRTIASALSVFHTASPSTLEWAEAHELLQSVRDSPHGFLSGFALVDARHGYNDAERYFGMSLIRHAVMKHWDFVFDASRPTFVVQQLIDLALSVYSIAVSA